MQVSQTGKRTWWDKSFRADTCPAGAPRRALPGIPTACTAPTFTITICSFRDGSDSCCAPAGGRTPHAGLLGWSRSHPLGRFKALEEQTGPWSSCLVPAKPLSCCQGEITPLYSLCIVLTSPRGKLIPDVLTDLCDLLNQLLFLWGAEQTPPWAPSSSWEESGRHCHWGSSQKPSPNFSACPISIFSARHTLSTSAMRRGGARGWQAVRKVRPINHGRDVPQHLLRTEEHIDRSVHNINISTQKRSLKVKTITCFIKLSP